MGCQATPLKAQGQKGLILRISTLSQKPPEKSISKTDLMWEDAFNFCCKVIIREVELEIKLFLLLYHTCCTRNMPLLQIQI